MHLVNCKTLRWATILATAFCLSSFASVGEAATQTLDRIDRELKAAYLANIAKFVSWEGRGSKVNLCIHDDSSLLEFVPALDSQQLGEDKVLNVHVGEFNINECEMLYLDEASIEQNKIAPLHHDTPWLLVVGDLPGGLKRGLTIQFFTRDLKLRMAIDEKKVATASYKISSKLLRLSRNLN